MKEVTGRYGDIIGNIYIPIQEIGASNVMLDIQRSQLIADCPSSKHWGQMSIFSNGGFSSSWFAVKPPAVDGSSGGLGW